MYYVVEDDEGVWLTETPAETDTILFETEDQALAEAVLARECQQ